MAHLALLARLRLALLGCAATAAAAASPATPSAAPSAVRRLRARPLRRRALAAAGLAAMRRCDDVEVEGLVLLDQLLQPQVVAHAKPGRLLGRRGGIRRAALRHLGLLGLGLLGCRRLGPRRKSRQRRTIHRHRLVGELLDRQALVVGRVGRVKRLADGVAELVEPLQMTLEQMGQAQERRRVALGLKLSLLGRQRTLQLLRRQRRVGVAVAEVALQPVEEAVHVQREQPVDVVHEAEELLLLLVDQPLLAVEQRVQEGGPRLRAGGRLGLLLLGGGGERALQLVALERTVEEGARSRDHGLVAVVLPAQLLLGQLGAARWPHVELERHDIRDALGGMRQALRQHRAHHVQPLAPHGREAAVEQAVEHGALVELQHRGQRRRRVDLALEAAIGRHLARGATRLRRRLQSSLLLPERLALLLLRLQQQEQVGQRLLLERGRRAWAGLQGATQDVLAAHCELGLPHAEVAQPLHRVQRRLAARLLGERKQDREDLLVDRAAREHVHPVASERAGLVATRVEIEVAAKQAGAKQRAHDLLGNGSRRGGSGLLLPQQVAQARERVSHQLAVLRDLADRAECTDDAVHRRLFHAEDEGREVLLELLEQRAGRVVEQRQQPRQHLADVADGGGALLVLQVDGEQLDVRQQHGRTRRAEDGERM
eukprot:scaffold91996_cov63-Phaeocystis_antarctica.AAC.2